MDRKVTGKYFAELRVGERFNFSPVEVSESMINDFSSLTGDRNLLHRNEEFASSSPFKTRISPGMLTASLAVAPLGDQTFNGTAVAMTESHWNYLGPVHIGDRLKIDALVESMEARGEGKSGGKVCFGIRVENQEGKPVLTGNIAVLIK